jgi:hypothetical protein
MSLIQNERIKLAANALDGASTACLSIGVLGPTVALLYNFGATTAQFNAILVCVGSVFWLVMAGGLHATDRYILRGLR